MNLGVSSYICSAGLKAVTSAGSLGPYFALKYFVPFYDYRIDKTICRGISGTTSATSISALNLVSATNATLFGEKIFANVPYTLSDSRFLYWTSNMGSLPEGITNNNVISQQSVSTDVNLLYGKPLSNTVSGTSAYSSATGYFTVTNTNVLSGTELTQYNPLSAVSWPSSAFFKVASYSPNVNGITSATGSYKCRIPPGTGSFKFNGLAVYAVKVDNNGFDDSGNGMNVFNYNPVLFAVILFDQAQYKQETVGGINDFEISLDLGFDWNTVNPGSSAIPTYVNSNYWIKLPTATTTSAYAINYDGDVVVSTSAVPGSWMPRAKLTVTDPQKGQLRLANDDSRFTDFRTIRFPISLSEVTPNYNDRAVLAIDTSCPDDSLIQVGYRTSAVGIKSIAMGCYASATGYYNGGFLVDDFPEEVDINDTRNDTGGYTVSIGVKTLSQGFGSWAIGYNTSAIGYLNFAGGDSSIASYAAYDAAVYLPDSAPLNGLNFAFGKYTSAISRISAIGDCGYNDSGYDYINADDESYGSNVAFGVRTIANGGLAFVHGFASSASGMGSISFGYKNLSDGCFSFTVGSNNVAKNVGTVAIGNQTSAISNFGLAFGRKSLAGNEEQDNSNFCVAIGENVSATKSHAIAIGKYAFASEFNSIAIGQEYGGLGGSIDTSLTVSTGINSIAIGSKTSATNLQAISFGHVNLASNVGSIAIGNSNIVDGAYGVAIGSENIASSKFAISMGYQNYSNGYYAFAMNEKTSATGESSFAGISNSIASGKYSIALGYQASATIDNAVAIGYKASAQHLNSFAIGNKATTDKVNQIVFGNCDTDEVVIKAKNINIGGNCGSNIIMPGIKQLNDPIGVYINLFGQSQYSNYMLDVQMYRNGQTSKIRLQPTNPALDTWVVISLDIDKTIKFKAQRKDNYEGGDSVIHTLSPGMELFIPARVENNAYSSDNLLQLCLDYDNNYAIFYCHGVYGSGGTGLPESRSSVKNDALRATQLIYSNDSINSPNTPYGGIGYSHHHLYYNRNVNSIVGHFTGQVNDGNPNKTILNEVYLNVNKFAIDGIFAFNLLLNNASSSGSPKAGIYRVDKDGNTTKYVESYTGSSTNSALSGLVMNTGDVSHFLVTDRVNS